MTWDAVRLVRRHGRDWTAEFAPVGAELGRLRCRQAIIDGEIAAPDARGVTNVADMRRVIAREPCRLAFYGFDLLWLDGENLRERPLLERKRSLKVLLRPGGRLLYSDHVAGPDGAAFYAAACKAGCEGIVSKRGDAPYQSGESRSWRKIKPAEVRARQAEAYRRGLR